MPPSLRRLALILGLAASPLAPLAAGAVGSAHAEEPEVHVSRGVVKAIAEGRREITIAHEDIPGFMVAMVMTFEPSSPAQLEGFAPGDAVDFSFQVRGPRRVLTAISKRPSR